MRSILGSRLAENSASVSTRFQSGSNPARRNSRSTSSASLGLSSTMRTRSGWVLLGIVWLVIWFGRLIKKKPIHSEVVHGCDEALEVHRLDEITVHAQPIAFRYIAVLLGRRQHDDGSAPGALIALDAPQHLHSVHLGQFQIEQDDLGAILDLASGVLAFAKDELHCFHAIAGDLDAIR